MNYLAIGDSYTIGEGVESTENFPNQLAKKTGINKPQIIAKTGWTTTNLLEAIAQENLDETYDFVSLLIGVNNQYQGKSRQLFLDELEKLIQIGLDKVKEKSNFYLITIPDYGVTPFADTWQSYVASDINWYNQQIKNAGKMHKLTVIDITPISKKAKNNKALLASDLLHPSAEMYKLWIDNIMDK